MTNGLDSDLIRQFRNLFEAGTVAGLTDGQLLERFLGGREQGGEVAFEALVARHGPMVLGVCRRALADPNDAADAFQATFLVLVRKARSVRVDDSLGRWLYGVSRKVAARARVVAARHPKGEAESIDSVPAPCPDPDRFERLAMLDEELGRLPEAFRSAIVLCDLGGSTHEEAARDLRCPVGTIKSRLSRGRRKLRERLERRGLTPSALAIVPSVPASLLQATARVSWLSAISSPKAAGMVPASVVLAEGVLKSMTGFTMKLAASAVLSVGVLATGAGVLAVGQERAEPSKPIAEPKAAGSSEVGVRLIEFDGSRIEVDGQEVPFDGLTDAVKAPTGAGSRPSGRATIRASSEVKYSDLLRAIEAIRGAGIRDIAFEAAELKGEALPPDDSLARLRHDLENWKKRLAKAERIAANKDDPAILRARKEVSRIEAEIDRITKRAAEAEVDKGIALHGFVYPSIKPGRKPWPDAGVGFEPPRELSKVSMPEYIVEPPDIIIVEVLKALPGRPITGERLVRPDGTISLGFYGEVPVAGLSTTQIKAKVALHLREWLEDKTLGLTRTDPKTGREIPVDPSRTDAIFVDVVSWNSKVYYVLGDVGTPGRLPITGNETVLDGINFAGGPIPGRSDCRVRLVRPNLLGSKGEVSLDVDLDAIINRGDVSTNYQLFPGDRVIVSRDPKAAPVAEPAKKPEAPSSSDVDARLQAMERKLDEVLKALGRPSKPNGPGLGP